ncbi:hypothetical protein HW49_08080 [Porphyromonadaceae bacterium COT-184 OH4590]|nr:hypothetical protein HW49_08080 [Porphyromonadaceae bacterium COT-184 OH4590]
MENIFLLLALFATIKSLFMTVLLPNKWYRLGFGVLLGVFIFLSHDYVMDFNKLQVQHLLSTQSSLLDISLIVMIDSLLSLYFCFARIKNPDPDNKQKRYTKILRYIPSLLVFPSLFYLHIHLLFSFAGIDFMYITSGFAVFIVSVFIISSLFMRRVFGEKEILIELSLLLTLMLFLITVCSYVFHPSATLYTYSMPVNWLECITTSGLLLVTMFAGYLFTYIKKIIKHKN